MEDKSWIERSLEWCGRQIEAAANFVVGIPIAALAALAVLATYVSKFEPTDPFRLNVFGDSLRTTRVKFDQLVLGVMLAACGAYVFWAWQKGFSFTGATDFAVAGLALIMFLILMIFDRSLGVVDLYGVKHKWRYWLSRGAVLFVLAFVTAIPVELAYFGPEIEQRIAAIEKTKVDAIRGEAKAYETKLAGERTGSADLALSGQAGDVVSRRAGERKAMVAQQTADRAEITKRLTDASEDAAREAAGKKYGGRGIGPSTILLNRQVADIRTELKEFDAAARKERSEFDATTEQMRTGAVKTVTDAHDKLTASLDDKLHAIEVMKPEALSAAYGGTWKQPRGFLERKIMLDQIVDEPQLDADGKVMDVWMTRNQQVAWGCRIMMMVPELMVLLWKFLLCSAEFGIYLSRKMQALAGNEEAINLFIPQAKDKDPEAIGVLRMIAGKHAAAREVLLQLGYDGNVEVAGWSKDKVALHAEFGDACVSASKAHQAFEERFRQMCAVRIGYGSYAAGMSRSELVRQAQADWLASVQDAFTHLARVESRMFTQGYRVLGWPSELIQGDPRRIRPLWELSDDKLEETYGWSNPSTVIFKNAPTA